MLEHHLFVEKYRPKTIEECILPSGLTALFKGIVESGRIPSLILAGTQGTGKTSCARALCEQVGADYILINASNENGIETFRSKIMQFASTVSLTDAKKVVILDEADAMTGAAQSIFRALLEEVSSNCTFILTCNFKNKLIDALHSRCTPIDFKITNKEKPKLATAFFKRLIEIMTIEGIEYDKAAIVELIQRFFPDFRRTLNEIQRYASAGKIDTGILINHLDEKSFKGLIDNLREKKFSSVRSWIGQHSDLEQHEIFRHLYDNAYSLIEDSSIPQLILILADYQHRGAFAVDAEINLMGAMVEIMSEVTFK